MSAASCCAADSSGRRRGLGQRRAGSTPVPAGELDLGQAGLGRGVRRGSARILRYAASAASRSPLISASSAASRRGSSGCPTLTPPALSTASIHCRSWASGTTPEKASTGWPPTTATTIGMPCTRNIWAIRGLASTSILAEHPGAAALGGQPLQHRRELLARLAPLGPEVHHDRRGQRPLQHRRTGRSPR